MQLIKDFFTTQKIIGTYWASKIILAPRIKSHIFRNQHSNYYIPAVQRFLKSISKGVLIHDKSNVLCPTKGEGIKKIWVLWWQGANEMPDVIKLCYESILRNANGFEVILIDQNNLSQYVTLPEFIYKKVERKQISFTHLSDIIRLYLLTTYGGLWIDSAIFVTKPITFDSSLGFFSPNLHREVNSHSMGKWCIGVMYSLPNNAYLQVALNCILKYWKNYNAAFDYLFFDAIMHLCYETYPSFKKIIDCQPNSAPNLHESRYTFDKEADIDHFSKLLSDNMFLSLTWRINYPIVTEQNKPTYYGLIKMVYK